MLEKDKEQRAKIIQLKTHKWYVLGDSALEWKESSAKVNLERTIEEEKEKKEKALIKKLMREEKKLEE